MKRAGRVINRLRGIEESYKNGFGEKTLKNNPVKTWV
jgi:hypothetical protein